MPLEQIIELSIEETNKLRAELGLAPLRVRGPLVVHTGDHGDDDGGKMDLAVQHEQQQQLATSSNKKSGEDNVLELSVEDTNELRAKLGLPPLREKALSRPIVHAPASQRDEEKATAERIEKAQLERQVKEGIANFSLHKSLAEEAETSALSWAQQMRKKKGKGTQSTTTTSKGSLSKEKRVGDEKKDYGEEDIKGVKVAHSVTEIEQGSTTILTLQDVPLLQTDEASKKTLGLTSEDDVQLENVNLAEQRMLGDNLKEKRKMELGMGRAGGYAGFDDDEFEELGGSQAPSRFARGKLLGTEEGKKKKVKGFQIGSTLMDLENQQESDLFASAEGKTVSLQPSQADITISDYMTLEEEEADREKKKKSKKKEFKKKKKKKGSKKRRAELSDEDDDGDIPEREKKGILEELDETAVEETAILKRRKRSDDEERDEEEIGGNAPINSLDLENVDEGKADKRAKFNAAMAKSNARAKQAFKSHESRPAVVDEDADDVFLTAALEKARRLNRLKKMASAKKVPRGAQAVVDALKKREEIAPPDEANISGTVVFAVDETREFTRALRAKNEQAERERTKKAAKNANVEIKQEDDHMMETDNTVSKLGKAEEPVEEEDIKELAKQVKEDLDDGPTGTLDGATGSSVAVGRGLGGVLSMLKQTGELTRRNAGKEEMRGRAKDKRTYEDYEPLNLSQVVKIDERTATEKDKELANREVKLEYRDKHGRLLTRHEAFRDLSYQFHGYGSGKRKEEKRKEQIAREQAEARLASRQAAEGGGGTFGALKATQKATGKAFVVHKT